MKPEINLRECLTVEELADCVNLQREIFALPEIELSPVRHFIVTKNAGGFTLGAYSDDELIGFVLSVPAFLRGEKAFYSHMTAVKKDFQGFGIGTKLKWAQREMALEKGVKYIKWTFQPVQARNAFFNLEKLGAIIRRYTPNFYGTDYSTSRAQGGKHGLDSDRLFAEWHLTSEKVKNLANGENFTETGEVLQKIEIPNDWDEIVKNDIQRAIFEQNRIKAEFQNAFAKGLIAKGFERSETNPKYLLF